MHVTVPLWMITWSNTLVYSCECVCSVLLSYLVNVFFYVTWVVWCLLSCFIFRCNWYRDWISGMNMYVCISRVYLVYTTNPVWVLQVQEYVQDVVQMYHFTICTSDTLLFTGCFCHFYFLSFYFSTCTFLPKARGNFA